MNIELVEKAKALAPILKERAAECEKKRSVPNQSIADMVDTGLLKTLVPKRYGGHQADWETLYEVLFQLARGDAAQAWVAAVLAVHAIDITMFGGKAQDEIWGGEAFGLLCSGVAPNGKGERVEGGARINGRWGFSSGNVHAHWAQLGVMIPDVQTGKPEYHLCLVPREECESEDTWFAMGLVGTGSGDLIVKDAFVPNYRMITRLSQREGNSPGTALHEDKIYASPFLTIGPTSLAVVIAGAAQGALDEYIGFTKERHKRGNPAAERESMQLRVAESSAEIDCAHLLLMRIAESTTRAMREDGFLSTDIRARSRRDAGYCCNLARRAVERLFEESGANGLYLNSPFQRYYRDVKAGATHFGLGWDRCGAAYGKYAFGIDPGPDAF